VFQLYSTSKQDALRHMMLSIRERSNVLIKSEWRFLRLFFTPLFLLWFLFVKSIGISRCTVHRYLNPETSISLLPVVSGKGLDFYCESPRFRSLPRHRLS
jgi:hypothetical protein